MRKITGRYILQEDIIIENKKLLGRPAEGKILKLKKYDTIWLDNSYVGNIFRGENSIGLEVFVDFMENIVDYFINNPKHFSRKSGDSVIITRKEIIKKILELHDKIDELQKEINILVKESRNISDEDEDLVESIESYYSN